MRARILSFVDFELRSVSAPLGWKLFEDVISSRGRERTCCCRSWICFFGGAPPCAFILLCESVVRLV